MQLQHECTCEWSWGSQPVHQSTCRQLPIESTLEGTAGGRHCHTHLQAVPQLGSPSPSAYLAQAQRQPPKEPEVHLDELVTSQDWDTYPGAGHAGSSLGATLTLLLWPSSCKTCPSSAAPCPLRGCTWLSGPHNGTPTVPGTLLTCSSLTQPQQGSLCSALMCSMLTLMLKLAFQACQGQKQGTLDVSYNQAKSQRSAHYAFRAALSQSGSHPPKILHPTVF